MPELSGWRRAAASLVLGAGLALALAPFRQPAALALCLPLILKLGASARDTRAAALTGWLAGTGYFGIALFWLAQPFLVDVQRHGWMAPFAPLLMAMGLAMFWALGFGAAWRWTGPGPRRILALTAALALAEAGRSTLFTGFPWALFAMGLVDLGAGQVLSLTGPFGLGLLILLLAAAIAAFGLRGLAAAAVVFLLATLWGNLRMPEIAAPRGDGFALRLVQPNADQRQKWDADWIDLYYRRMLDYSAARQTTEPGLVIWPETAVPFILSGAPDAMAEIAATAAPARVALGIRDLRGEPGDEDITNSLVVLDEAGASAALYDKTHLVPFGEYIPFAGILGQLGLGPLTAENLRGFTAGSASGPVVVRGLPVFLPLICYEAIFPGEIRRHRGEAEWLLQVTNDAWFGTFSGPWQHLDQARMRAIEQGLPLARAANTGISAVIDPYGRIVAAVPLGMAGFVDAALPVPLAPTVYARAGDWPWLLAALLILAALRRRQV